MEERTRIYWTRKDTYSISIFSAILLRFANEQITRADSTGSVRLSAFPEDSIIVVVRAFAPKGKEMQS
jgi:hypothetical protein